MKARPKWWVDYIAAIKRFQLLTASCGYRLEKTTGKLDERPSRR